MDRTLSSSRTFTLHFDDEDWSILEEAARTEKLHKSDIVRRAVRDYAKRLRATETKLTGTDS